MATTFFLFPAQPNRATDANGKPVDNAKAYYFEAGTTTPLTVYSDTGLTTAHASPQRSDANGYFAPAYISGPDEVKIRVDDASDNVLYTVDYVTGQPVGGLDAASIPFTATARIAADDAQEAIEDVDRTVEYLQAAGTPVVTTGSANAYLLDTGITSYVAYATGDAFLMEASFANTGDCTLNVDSLGAKNLRLKTGGTKTILASGEIQTGHILKVRYDGTHFVVQQHWRPMATQAQAEAGTAQGVVMDALRTKQAITAQTIKYTEGTLVATTSGTTKDYTGIADNVVQIVIGIHNLSTSGTNSLLLQIGDSGGIENTGYNSGAFSGASAYDTTGFILTNGLTAAGLYSGQITLTRMDKATFLWTCKADIASDSVGFNSAAGSKALTARLDRIRLTTVGGTDTFDSGSLNIMHLASVAT